MTPRACLTKVFRPSGLLMAAVILLHAALLARHAYHKKFEYNPADEPIYLGAGAVIWKEHEVAQKFTEYHPPFAFYLGSLFLPDDAIPWDQRTDWFAESLRRGDDHWLIYLGSVGFDVVKHAAQHPAYLRSLFLRARLAFIFLSVVLCVAVAFTLAPLGRGVSLLGLCIYALSPLVLRQVPAILTDFTFTFFITGSVLAFYAWLKNPSMAWLTAASVLYGLALGSKVSGVLMAPAYALMILSLSRKSIRVKISETCLMLAVSFLSLWAVYGFQFESIRSVETNHHAFPVHERDGLVSPTSFFEKAVPGLYEKRLPMPSFFMAVRWAYHRSRERQREPLPRGWRACEDKSCYGPAVILSFFPKAWILLLGFVGLGVIRRKGGFSWASGRRDSALVLWSWPAIYALAAFTSELQLGPRHFFPLFPLSLLAALSMLGAGANLPRRWIVILAAIIVAEFVLFCAGLA